MNKLYRTLVLFLIAFASKGQTISAIEVNSNPFIKRTQVTYTVQVSDTISLIIINQYGQTIDTVINNQLRVSGIYQDSVKMDNRPDGAYFLIIKDRSKVLVGLKIIKSITTGIVNVLNDVSVNVYPNPVIDKLSVEYAGVSEERSLIITNVLGQIIYSLVDLKLKQEIDLIFLPAGVYYLKVQSHSTRKIFKIIKE